MSQSSPLEMANRVRVDKKFVERLAPGYTNAIQNRFNSDAVLITFSPAETTRKVINEWVSKQTAGVIDNLLPSGAISTDTKLILTNAIHFKSAWQVPFDKENTKLLPFYISPDQNITVPTMSKEMLIRSGVVDNAIVFELPFKDSTYSLMIAMPPKGQSIQAFEAQLTGAAIVQWHPQIKRETCNVSIPRFSIKPISISLKPMLEEMRIILPFQGGADFTKMHGMQDSDINLDNVYHAAGITIDETGGEASAATAVLMGVNRSLRVDRKPSCSVNRSFIFAIVHTETGAPIFLGKITNPAQ